MSLAALAVGTWVALCATQVEARAADAPAAESAAATPTTLEAWLGVSEGYRGRTAPGDFANDHDALFTLDGGARAADGQLAVDVSAALFADLDGESRTLMSVHDARGPVDLLVDTLEVHAQKQPWLARASLGRLTVLEGWPITLDGVAAALVPVRAESVAWTVFASAGRTVHFFDLDDQLFERFVGSIGTGLVLLDHIKLELDYRGLLEDSGHGALQHSYGASYAQQVSDLAWWQLYARGLDEELSHVGARGHVGYDPWRVGLDVDVLEQTTTIGEVFEGQNPFFSVLGESAPFVRGGADAFARADAGFLDAGAHLGAAGRHVLSGPQQPFNRDSARVYASVDVADVVVDGPFAALILSYDFATTPTQDAVVALGGSAGYATDGLRAAVGTSWDRTKYRYYRDVEELIDVRTFSASVDVKAWRLLRVRASYTLELAGRTVHTGQLVLSHDLEGAW